MFHDIFTAIVVLSVFGIVGDTIVKVMKARTGGKKLEGQLERMDALLADQNAALVAAHQGLADQQAQIQELQERLEFAERVLTQSRERQGLGPGT